MRDDLDDLEFDDSDRFIDGIHNYCDRWCERCPLTARCRLFAMEAEFESAAESHDPENAAFWDALELTFEQAEGDEEFGFELDAQFVSAAKKAGLDGLKGHRSVGGMRASIYNAFPSDGVDALIEAMRTFEAEHA